uniref:Uncharacterized protein n=1 Tax=Utricularia reniformis TaxID=192314 RepID=A0A1Y0B226_9LAMI|nr:hypothetical protein AEK19_MT1304 [Utricularia reniformis]ART31505.1 hypothetical protein AEK19_MT1304 [Utricularia reniformis]
MPSSSGPFTKAPIESTSDFSNVACAPLARSLTLLVEEVVSPLFRTRLPLYLERKQRINLPSLY